MMFSSYTVKRTCEKLIQEIYKNMGAETEDTVSALFEIKHYIE